MCLAIPGQVLDLVDEERRLARVSVAGVRRTVNVALLDGAIKPLSAGDWVLIHVGFAISRVDEEKALATLQFLEQMGAEYQQAIREIREIRTRAMRASTRARRHDATIHV